MRYKRTIYSSLVAGALGLALSGSVFAAQDDDFDFDTTQDLYDICLTPNNAPEYIPARFACRAFIEAAVQYHDQVSDRKRMKRLICYPSSATVADGRSAFLSWVEANKDDSEKMNEMPVVGLVRALAAKYPCR